MANLPIGILLILLLLSEIGGETRLDKSPNQNRVSSQIVAVGQQQFTTIGGLKVLAQGVMSSVEEPFVAVCRDLETYQALRKLDDKLPNLNQEFFNSHAVIAAYLGTRNTGGYTVQIEQKGDPKIDYRGPNRSRLEVTEKTPAKGAMVPQVITSPYIAVSVEVNGAPPLILSLDDAWRKKQQFYRIKTGQFTMGGGFAGTSEQWEPHGELLTLRAPGLVSFYISIAGNGAHKERFLGDFATGMMQKNEITIKKMSTDLFVDGPDGGFSATGSFKDGDAKLSLMFRSLRAIVSDGYSGAGTLEAEAVGSPTTPKPSGVG